MSEPTGPHLCGKRGRVDGLVKGGNEFPYVTEQKQPDDAQGDSGDAIFTTAQRKHVSPDGGGRRHGRLLRLQGQ